MSRLEGDRLVPSFPARPHRRGGGRGVRVSHSPRAPPPRGGLRGSGGRPLRRWPVGDARGGDASPCGRPLTGAAAALDARPPALNVWAAAATPGRPAASGRLAGGGGGARRWTRARQGTCGPAPCPPPPPAPDATRPVSPLFCLSRVSVVVFFRHSLPSLGSRHANPPRRSAPRRFVAATPLQFFQCPRRGGRWFPPTLQFPLPPHSLSSAGPTRPPETLGDVCRPTRGTRAGNPLVATATIPLSLCAQAVRRPSSPCDGETLAPCRRQVRVG